MHCPRWNNDFYISNARIQYGLLNWKRVSVTHTLFASFCRFVHTFFFGFLKFISCSVSRLAPLAIRSSLWTVSDHRIAYVCAVCARRGDANAELISPRQPCFGIVCVVVCHVAMTVMAMTLSTINHSRWLIGHTAWVESLCLPPIRCGLTVRNYQLCCSSQ